MPYPMQTEFKPEMVDVVFGSLPILFHQSCWFVSINVVFVEVVLTTRDRISIGVVMDGMTVSCN
jgi:hypothetical protein